MFRTPVGRWQRAEWGCAALLALAVLFVDQQNVAAQAERDVETLKEILHVYEKREEQLNPVWVRFHLTHWQSLAWRKAAAPHEVPAEIRWTEEGEFARKGSKKRSWGKGGPSSPTGNGTASDSLFSMGR